MIKDFISNYFGFNRQQRRGLWLLLLISFILLLIRIIYPYFMEPAKIVVQDLPMVERKLDSAYRAVRAYSKTNYSKEAVKTRAHFLFDPNTVSLQQLIALGFSEHPAQTLIKLRSKGFVFREKQDLLKVYGISERFFTLVEPYIFIPPGKNPPSKNTLTEKRTGFSAPPANSPLELNSADSTSLLTLPGIGPVFAKRILKYRELLGGYTHSEQLKEVYGINAELYEKIGPLVFADASHLKKINLNKDDFKTLNKHPYLSYELTKTIFDWRRKTILNATNLKDLLHDEVLYQKLLPYLAFDQG